MCISYPFFMWASKAFIKLSSSHTCNVLKIWIRWNTPIHVDAASGGFIAPFLYPDLEWDFRLPLVKSINVSGHKYGLVYAGIGWVIWRSKEDLPDELIFHINYLGSDQPTFTLNFSKGKQHYINATVTETCPITKQPMCEMVPVYLIRLARRLDGLVSLSYVP